MTMAIQSLQQRRERTAPTRISASAEPEETKPSRPQNPEIQQPPKPAAKVEEKPRSTEADAVLVKFNKLGQEGSTCFMENIYQHTKEKFGDCLALIRDNFDSLKFSKPRKSSDEVVLIKYLYARACTGLNSYKEVMNGHNMLREILEQHKSVKFPATFYGMSLVFKKLNRYDEALRYAE